MRGASARLGRGGRRRSALRWWSAGLCCVLLVLGPRLRAEGSATVLAERFTRLLSELRLSEARAVLDALPGALKETAWAEQARALLAFHEGDYGEARRAMAASLSKRPAEGDGDERLGWMRLIEQAERHAGVLVEARSPDGRYVVLHPPGTGAVLVPLALEVLRRQDEALSRWSGYRHPGPIRLELYGDVATLADVSTLRLEDIERTGIVALCKWDRLMVTSPRFMPNGYAWMDTVAHELVHLYVSRLTFDRAPVWLQEGLAKSLERAWRLPDGAEVHLNPRLPAPVERLLLEAARKGSLVPFERLHPSIALLDSQREAALAFAQVATLVQYVARRYGAAVWSEVLRRLQRGQDVEAALQSVLGGAWERVLAAWKQALVAREPPRVPSAQRALMGMPVRDEERAGALRPDVRRNLRLGDLLWDRGHPGTARRYYEAAWRAAPERLGLAIRFARAALAAGEAGVALEAARKVAERFPEDASARAVLSASLLAAGAREDALREAFESLALNPFDPLPHCVRAEGGASETLRTEAERWCERLSEARP